MQADRLAKVVISSCQLLAICILLLVAEGCRENPTTVSGTVTLDGKPFSIAPDARGTVIFQPASGQGTTATGLLDPAGNFSLAMGSSQEVTPGKYQVAVSVVQLLPKTEGAEQGAKRITPAKYASVSDSGLVADVWPGENRLNFDLASNADEGNASSPSSTSSSSGTTGPESSENPTGKN